ncbi:recombinase family protein [Lichenibacterium minor]|uniref:recombinase family protein n=1 Tax=Lichenibacterium minor TaxID=2316528 RepID=UPI00315D9C6D
MFVTYCRVSTARQGRSGLGLEAQRAAVKAYLREGEWRIAGEFVEVESGKNADRPELAKALTMARLHRAALVVAKVDRLTRSLAFLSRLLEAGVDVRFCDLPQIEGPTGRFMLQQMAAVAELEAGLIGDRTRKALAAKAAWYATLDEQARQALRSAGKATQLGGDRGARLTAEQRARGRAVRTSQALERALDLAPVIADLRASGAYTLAALAEGLNKDGITASRGGAWSATQVKRVLLKSSVLPSS